MNLSALILLSLALTAAPAEAKDALWQRAVAISAINRDLVPGTWTEREEIFDGEGESHLVSRTKVTFKQVGSKVRVDLAEAVSNDVDITAERRKQFDELRPRFRMRPEFNPFNPAHQSDVAPKRDGRTRREGEQVLVAYDYVQKTENGRWRGTAWVDDATGMPVSVNARLTGLPKMDGKDEIRETVLNVHYRSGPDGTWYPTRIVEFTRAILNNFPYSDFYGSIETAITLEGYWKITFN